MQNKEGIFSLHELNQLKNFCDNCAKEDKKIYEERKKNPSYVPIDKKPEIPSYKNINNNKIGNKSNNNNQKNNNNNSNKKFSESFQKKLKLFEPK